MKLYLVFTKKGLAVIIAAVIITLIILSRFTSVNTDYLDGSTNKKRISYIQSLGYSVSTSSVSSKNTEIPEEFSDVYINYNKIQKDAGFDLSEYKGEEVTIYTYDLEDSEKFLNMIVFKGKIIGGDISSHLLGGSMVPLSAKNEEKG